MSAPGQRTGPPGDLMEMHKIQVVSMPAISAFILQPTGQGVILILKKHISKGIAA